MKKKYIAIIVALVLILGSTAYYFAKVKNTQKTSGVPYVTVTRGNIVMHIDGSGNLDVDKRVITLKGNGTVAKVYHKVGDKVKAGELLYQIEDDNLNQQVQNALISVELAQQQLDNDTKTYNNTVSNQNIVSPYSGIVDSVNVSTGQNVNPGVAIATIADYSNATVKVPFNGSQINDIKVGQTADIYLYDSFATVTGTVTDVSTQAIPVNGAPYYYVTVTLPNPGALTDGTKVQVTVHTSAGDERAIQDGTLSVKTTNIVTSQIQGTVANINVKQGQKINAGTVLATLTTNVDDTAIKRDQLNLQQAQNNYNNLQNQLDNLSIYAPIDGVIISQNINEGDELGSNSYSTSSNNTASGSGGTASNSSGNVSVNSLSSLTNQAETAVIINDSNYSVDVPIDETDISKIKVGQKVTLTTDDLPGETFDGTVSEISSVPTIQNNVASYDVTVSLPYTDKLKLGQTMNASIIVAEKDNALLLPIEAVQTNGNNKYVILYDENNSNNSSRRRNIKQVQTGLYNDKYIEIVSGLNEGDKVLIFGAAATSSDGNNNRSGFGGFGGGGNFGNRSFGGGAGGAGFIVRQQSGGNRSRN
ncbi:HlyD family efflux transporter periplasmic adaptor subunit [Thermoanaerobacterium saccharolyticum]|uniref:efflux RND transporter periplasmic adaptor subunit n=1 Tax=Thermoanaerobacterium saccharolyticum TaxID=28896 RepID=UPI002FDA2140